MNTYPDEYIDHWGRLYLATPAIRVGTTAISRAGQGRDHTGALNQRTAGRR